MLYQLYEAQRSLMEPFSDFAQAASKLYGQGAVWGQLPMAQRMAAGYDLLYRLGKDYEKPEFNIKSVKVDGEDVVIQEASSSTSPSANCAASSASPTSRTSSRRSRASPWC
jgi:poly(3-hydroxybutyrate) depolymerase